MIIKNKHNNENLKKKLLGGEKNIILIIIIILSIILFFIILWAMIKSMKSTPVLDITSQINFTDTIDKFLHNLSINTNKLPRFYQLAFYEHNNHYATHGCR